MGREAIGVFAFILYKSTVAFPHCKQWIHPKTVPEKNCYVFVFHGVFDLYMKIKGKFIVELFTISQKFLLLWM